MRSPAALGLLVAVLLIAGCEVFRGVAPAGPLVTVETRGGLCVQGPCIGTVVVERDGRVHEIAPQPAELARVPERVRLRLEQAIRVADFTRLKGRPFTGECPVNFDGQELIYTFATGDGPVRLASCESEIDPSDPLFVAVEAALAINRQ